MKAKITERLEDVQAALAEAISGLQDAVEGDSDAAAAKRKAAEVQGAAQKLLAEAGPDRAEVQAAVTVSLERVAALVAKLAG